MSIQEFLDKHGKEFNLSYASLYRLITIGALKENIHYTRSYRAVRARFIVNEQRLLQFLKTGV